MSFRLSTEARSYYRQINEKSTTGEFDSLWDQYYLSAMAGIKDRSRVPEDDEPGEEFVTDVIQAYDDQKYEIYSTLIVAEIEREGIPWDEKQEIQDMMLKILDSSSHTRLSDYGTTVLNCYAEKGFRLIRSDITAPPELDEFLEQYQSFLEGLD
ncbi:MULTISPECIES: hypothetical protein [Haloferacaceae]|jgi:hypothetical protein|uniref:hypothetical protein n=1 Tax=Haloferacaceae TaxID=1644056 RepID=UPI000EF1FF38|nr:MULTISPECIES: hypothetical protein [Haloferacales]RLM83823.1 hypothetical protein D3D02_16560 [Halobellus sp. Atlit-38R]